MYDEKSKLIRVPCALRAYPTEIIPMGENVIIPSLLLRKQKYLPLGILTTLMTSSKTQWECNESKVSWSKCDKGLFRNKVKYHVGNCVYVTLVARATCIEIRVEERNGFKPEDNTFVRLCESLKNELRKVTVDTVDFQTFLVCPKNSDHFAKHFKEDKYTCEDCSPPHTAEMKNCSVWFSKNVSQNILDHIPVQISSDPSGVEKSSPKNVKEVKSYFTAGNDTKSNDDEKKKHFGKLKWFNIGLLLGEQLRSSSAELDCEYNDLEALLEEYRDRTADDFGDEVIRKWLKRDGANWESLYKSLKFFDTCVAKEIKNEHGANESCLNEVEGEPSESQEISFEEYKAEEYALTKCQCDIVAKIAKDLPYFSNQLAQDTFIRTGLERDIISKYGVTDGEKAGELFGHVIGRLRSSSPAESVELFEKFVEMFSRYSAYSYLAKKMMDKYVEKVPAYKRPRRLIEDRDDDGAAVDLSCPPRKVETEDEIWTPEKRTSPGHLGGYLQHIIVLILCVLLGLGLVWWRYNNQH